jgi:multiple sugar transport system substrate-binding protein
LKWDRGGNIMIELELSLMIQSAEQLRLLEEQLAAFGAKNRVHVHVTPLTWSTGWAEMVRASIYGKGAHVSEVGTTWVADLVGMNVLQALPKQTISSFGGAEGYLLQSWKSCFILGDPKMWAAPWLAGARVIYYRRDRFAKAGIDPETAFQTPAALQDTLARLSKAGEAYPAVVTTRRSLNTLHLISSWVWGAGGDFVTADGKGLSFTEAKALEGMAAYYSLGEYFGPAASDLTDARANELFWGGQAALTMDGTWVYLTQRQPLIPEVTANLGMGLLPGPSYVGGSNLVVWKHTTHPEAALELVRFLTNPEVALMGCRATGLLPARKDMLQSPEITSQFSQGMPFIRQVNAALESGRSWPNLSYGGLLEDKLTNALGMVWDEMLTSSARDKTDILRSTLQPLERRLKVALSPESS